MVHWIHNKFIDTFLLVGEQFHFKYKFSHQWGGFSKLKIGIRFRVEKIIWWRTHGGVGKNGIMLKYKYFRWIELYYGVTTWIFLYSPQADSDPEGTMGAKETLDVGSYNGSCTVGIHYLYN